MLKALKKVWSVIMSMFKVDGNLSIDTSNVYVDGIKADLSACHISDTDYYDLVNEGKCQDNVIYVVSSDYINAYNGQVKNIAAPTDLDDAATKKYVDEQIAQAVSSCSTMTRDEVIQISKEVFKSSLSSILSAI